MFGEGRKSEPSKNMSVITDGNLERLFSLLVGLQQSFGTILRPGNIMLYLKLLYFINNPLKDSLEQKDSKVLFKQHL